MGVVSGKTILGAGIRGRGLAVLQPPDSGKAIIFRAKGKFFGQN